MSKKLIFVVDDDEVIRDLISNFMEFEGHECKSFVNGQKCLEALVDRRPDCIVTDIHMPFMNGFQLLRASRRIHSDVPVILITGFAHFRRFFADKTARADGFLEKPFSLESLSALVDKCTKS